MARKKKDKPSKSWHGRLSGEADEETADLLASLDFDIALWKYDIAGSVAHARMLCEQGILTKKELAAISRGLDSIAADIEAGRLVVDVNLEDIHMVIEAALIKRAGKAGAKLHTGRSRNDQVALDLRLWARDAVDLLISGIENLQRAFVALAERNGRIVFPAYTHLQRAQPVLAGHALLAYVEMLQRDAERLGDARERINICPLGSGAVAGTSLPLDRERTAELLGFPKYTRNSIDAVSDRDFLAELCFCCAMLSVHLSRWCEDWIVYSATEFGLLELDDAFCTSSSMMPQKKNADTLELIRAKSAGAIAHLVGMLTLLKGLPLAYNRDMQDDKRFVIESVEAMLQSLAVAAGIVSTAELREADLSGGFLDATAMAEYLTTKGVPFREAHGIVGHIVAAAEKQGIGLPDIPIEELKKQSKAFGPDIAKHLGALNVVKNYAPDGSGGAKQLSKQLTFWKRRLGIHAKK